MKGRTRVATPTAALFSFILLLTFQSPTTSAICASPRSSTSGLLVDPSTLGGGCRRNVYHPRTAPSSSPQPAGRHDVLLDGEPTCSTSDGMIPSAVSCPASRNAAPTACAPGTRATAPPAPAGSPPPAAAAPRAVHVVKHCPSATAPAQAGLLDVPQGLRPPRPGRRAGGLGGEVATCATARSAPVRECPLVSF